MSIEWVKIDDLFVNWWSIMSRIQMIYGLLERLIKYPFQKAVLEKIGMMNFNTLF